MLSRRSLVFSAALLLILVPALVFAQTVTSSFIDTEEPPDEVLGQRLMDVLEVINSGERERMLALVRERYGPEMMRGSDAEQHTAFLQGVYEHHGGLQLIGFRRYDNPLPEGMIIGIVRSKLKESWHGLQLRFDTDGIITSFMIAAARPPLGLVPMPHLDDRQLVQELQEHVEEMAAADQFSGAILLARHGKPLLKKAYGLASREYQVANRIDTRFRLGSMNKMFTAVAVAQLVERKLLAFDDPVGKHLPEGWLDPAVAGTITIHHLLTHTSGLGDYLEGLLDTALYRFQDMEDYQPLLAGEAPAFEPGSRWAYSNTGFLLLGAVISQVTGESYYDYVRRHIYEPAGMTGSGHFDHTRPQPHLAVGYHQVDGEWRNNTLLLAPRGTSAGGGYSTVDDLLRFDIALRSGKLLTEESREILFSPKPSAPGYGYGFMIMGLAPDRVVGHGGTFPGVSAQLSMYLDSGYTLAVLCNGPGAQGITTKVIELIERAK